MSFGAPQMLYLLAALPVLCALFFWNENRAKKLLQRLVGARLQNDLAGDGWTVVRRDVSRADTPSTVRTAIQGVYNSDPANVKAVFLFGHVPILRSGNLNVDGHQARPMPADPST